MSALKTALSLNDIRRKILSHLMISTIAILFLIAILPLISIFIFVFQKGFSGLSLTFFTNLPVPVGESGGGLGQSFLGSIWLIVLASLIGIPWGIASGVYITEYGHGKSAWLLRFANDLLMGIPTIVVGLFVYAFVVYPFKGFSLFAGSIALVIIMIPMISRTTEEILKTVPKHLREAGLALGIPRWRMITNILLKGSRGAILTGVMLSVARISGETAPLLFTSFNNQYWPKSIFEPTSSLPVQIYTYAISPFESWQSQAWTGALVLILFVFAINISVRWIFKTHLRKKR